MPSRKRGHCSWPISGSGTEANEDVRRDVRRIDPCKPLVLGDPRPAGGADGGQLGRHGLQPEMHAGCAAWKTAPSAAGWITPPPMHHSAKKKAMFENSEHRFF